MNLPKNCNTRIKYAYNGNLANQVIQNDIFIRVFIQSKYLLQLKIIFFLQILNFQSFFSQLMLNFYVLIFQKLLWNIAKYDWYFTLIVLSIYLKIFKLQEVSFNHYKYVPEKVFKKLEYRKRINISNAFLSWASSYNAIHMQLLQYYSSYP